MQNLISRLPIMRQFTLLAVLGVLLTIAGIGLSLKHSHDLAYELKRSAIQHEAEEGAAIVRHFVDSEKSGALTRDEAQKRAIEAVGAIRFQGVNYVALLGFDGISLANANKNMVGKNVMNLKDLMGNPITRAQLAIATSGKPGFAEFYFKKIGEDVPKVKMSYNIGIPEWQMDVTTGEFADDLDTALFDSIVKLSEVFLPLLLGFLTIVYLMRRAVSRLLGSLCGSMRRLARGDLETQIDGCGRRDEIGAMATAVQVFKENALKLRESEFTAGRMQTQTEAERSRAAVAQAEAARHQSHVVDALATGLKRLSSGDLVFRIDQPFAADYDKLRVDFNGALKKLQDTMKTVSVTTAAIRVGSDEIFSASDDLSKRTEQQAASLEETAAALDEITAAVRKTAEGSEHARQLVSTAKKDAEHSGAIVRQAVQAMDGIEKSSSEIGQIIGVIDEIAFQTNLLALNAGVEAARAGDAGRGFAVVASEVRALAQRSAEAAKEIKALIAKSNQQVEIGVTHVGQTGQDLERIVAQVAEINGIVGDIAASVREQATGLQQVNTAVNQMDQVTQQNAAMVEESTAASHALVKETEDLAALMAGFQLELDAGQRAGSVVRHANSSSRSAPALKLVSYGGAARMSL